MPPRSVRFRITNIANGVSYDELLEALSTQIALDDVRLLRHTFKLDPHADGKTQVAEMELPSDEAELIRGAMQQAKVFVQRLGITTVIHFSELQEPEDRCSELPAPSNKAHDLASAPPGVTSSGALLPPLVARDSHRPVARAGSSGALDDDDDSDVNSQGSRPSRRRSPPESPGPAPRAPGPSRGAPAMELERAVPRHGSAAGRQGHSHLPQHRDAVAAAPGERDDAPWPARGETSARGSGERQAAGSRDQAPPRPPFDGRAHSRQPIGGSPVDDCGELEQTLDRGPEMAYCTRFLDAPNGDPKLLRACTAPCALQ
mmetsp:Transcript_126407/g.369342  ORF Transcript_126407/g.369342 Transcript_126407/m.369342 type:complete len:316 (+) Transcript_126407:106-1053(+)